MSGSQQDARFIALPVGQGDAFYLETSSGSVLVDGGRAVSSLAGLFKKTTGKDSVQIVVCTHNDADHANGLIGFLEAGVACQEVWLPARWLGVLPHVLAPSGEVLESLVGQAGQAAEELEELRERDLAKPHLRWPEDVLESYGSLLANRPSNDKGSDPEGSDRMQSGTPDGWPETLIEPLERCVEDICDQPIIWLEHPWLVRYWPYLHRGFPGLANRLFLGALDAGDRICRIARAAYQRGVLVRWFEYTKDTGMTPLPRKTAWVYPLNGRPVAYLPPVRIDRLLKFLALTTVNRESLVFFASSRNDSPGVLFSADSDLQHVALPRDLQNAIVTAPHHGSEANAKAYQTVKAHLGNGISGITWVRSDGRFRSRPGPSFLSVPGPRLCTICRSPSWRPKQAVELLVGQDCWVPTTKISRCQCC